MQVKETNIISNNTRGGHIFKKMLDDKMAISAHLQKGGKLSDLKDKYKFLDLLSLKNNR
jgi:hypothetical protein